MKRDEEMHRKRYLEWKQNAAKEFEKAVKEMIKEDRNVMPLLLWIYKED